MKNNSKNNKKDFDGWNEDKKILNNTERSLYFKEREIWWCKMGVNVGDEQDGANKTYQRSVLILKGMSKNTCFVAPLTTSENTHRYRIYVGEIDGKKAKVIISQIRLIDKKRLVNKVRFLEKNIFNEIRKTIKDVL